MLRTTFIYSHTETALYDFLLASLSRVSFRPLTTSLIHVVRPRATGVTDLLCPDYIARLGLPISLKHTIAQSDAASDLASHKEGQLADADLRHESES